jgi:hypothetical protein
MQSQQSSSTIVSSLIAIVSLIVLGIAAIQYTNDRQAERLLGKLGVSSPAEKDQCIMSWMNPNYIPLEVPKNIFSYKYKLYMYREGSRELKVSGIPVLFIHGNAGSYKQARSLGPAVVKSRQTSGPSEDSFNSVMQSLHRANLSAGVSIDLFTVDFTEELSAFHGQLLWDQAAYSNLCIKFILSMYKTGQKSVIIVGHSMGGMVARAVPLLSNYKDESINTIITLSTPHREHPFLVDSSLHSFYTNVNNKWILEEERFSDMTVVSISSGFRDTLIRDDTTRIDGIIPPENGFSVSPYSMSNVRISPDHLSVTWCRQLYNTLGNTLLELVNSPDNPKPGVYELPVEERMHIFRKNLLESATYKTLFNSGDYNFEQISKEKAIGSVNVKQLDLSTTKHYSFKPKSNPVKQSTLYEINNIQQLVQQGVDAVSMISNFRQDTFSVYGAKSESSAILDVLDSLVETLPFFKVDQSHHQDESINDIPHAILTIPDTVLKTYSSLFIHFKRVPEADLQFTLNFYSRRGMSLSQIILYILTIL